MRASNLISLLIAVLMLTGMLGVAGVMAEDQTAAQPGAPSDNSTNDVPSNDTIIVPRDNSIVPLPDNSTAPAANSTIKPLTLVLENHTYYPNDSVRIYVFNATEPIIDVIDPAGAIYNLTLTGINDSAFMGEYALNRSIILANYTVRATENATGAYVEDTFVVTTRQVSVTPAPDPPVMPDGRTNQTAIAEPLYIYLNLSKKDYVPSEHVGITVMTNAGTPAVVVQDPVNNTIWPAVSNIDNDTYASVYGLDRSIVLGNYTVLAYVNENGTYNYTMAYFNVTMGSRGSADNGLSIDYAAYDPVQKAVVVRAEVNSSALDISDIKDKPVFKGANIKSLKILPDIDSGVSPDNPIVKYKPKTKMVEVVLPVNSSNVDELSQRYNLSMEVFSTTMSVSGMPVITSGSLTPVTMHVALNDKVDGSWYRMAVNIPSSYRVESITRSDGKELSNYREVLDNGAVKDTLSWYVDNSTLYFYDDPINGYNISLVPPVALMSLSVELVDPGMLSAIIYPFNGTDDPAAMAGHDHLGRSGDNYAANDMGTTAGSRSAVNINGISYGNDYITKQDIFYTFNNKTTYYFNIAPDGRTESIIISNFSLSYGTGGLINITQKTILRGNDRWFTTIYYITNNGNADISSFKFYQYADFNYNDQDTHNSEYYDLTNDSVYGWDFTATAGQLQYGGFTSPAQSFAHDVRPDTSLSSEISNGKDLGGNDECSSNGAMALEWDKGTLRRGESWIIPVVWFFGYDVSDMWYQENLAKASVYDVGVKGFVYPYDSQNIPQNSSTLNINVTTMDVGLMDLGIYGLTANLTLNINGPNGYQQTYSNNSLYMSVPVKETDNAVFGWNTTSLASGDYTIQAYTTLTNATGVNVDQNASNDVIQITVHIRDFSLSPNQSMNVQFGDNVPYQLTAANLQNGGPSRNFSLTLSGSSAGWATGLYDGDYSHLIARDSNGDGLWDTINASYNDSGTAFITLAGNSNKSLLLVKEVPVTAEAATVDDTILTMSPIDTPGKTSSALLTTYTPLPPTVNKTFYLHPLYMNTSVDLNASSNTTLRNNMYTFWSQAPNFASNFTVVGNISVSLWINATMSNKAITASLFSTNGIQSNPIGSTTITPDSSTLKQYDFVISPGSGIVTVPAGWYIDLKIDNMNANNDMYLYHDSTHQSYVRVNTTTYVRTDTISTNNGTANTIYFLPGDTIYVKAKVTDPIGSYDIPAATYTLYAPNDSMMIQNASMALNGSDPASPSFWRNFTVSMPINSNYPLGRYNVSVTGYESNGVVHTRNLTFYVVTNQPEFSLYPSTLTRYGSAGTTVYLKHTVTNINAIQPDTIGITYTKSLNWTIALYEADGVTPLTDHDGDGLSDTGLLAPLAQKDILVKLTIPGIAGLGDINAINITGRSHSNTSITHMAYDQVIVVPSIAVKTLYMYPTPSLALNTSIYSGSSSTAIIAGGNATWSQAPAYANDFYIIGSPNVTIYASSSVSSSTVIVQLYSSNGTSSVLLASTNYMLAGLTSAPTMVSIPLPMGDQDSNTTVPAGNYLQVRLLNTGTADLSIYQSQAYPSRLDINTTSYISVVEAAAFDSSGNVISDTMPPSVIRVVANVTDPFGPYDIYRVDVSIYNGDSLLAIGPLAMNINQTGSSQTQKQYELNVSIPDNLSAGNYLAVVAAVETNAVTQNKSVPFSINYPLNVTASKSLAMSGNNNFIVTINLTNIGNHAITGVYAYDFYSNNYTLSNFSQARTFIPVNNGILTGAINVFGPFTIQAKQSVYITYNALGSGNYDISDLYVVGVDPHI